MYFWL